MASAKRVPLGPRWDISTLFGTLVGVDIAEKQHCKLRRLPSLLFLWAKSSFIGALGENVPRRCPKWLPATDGLEIRPPYIEPIGRTGELTLSRPTNWPEIACRAARIQLKCEAMDRQECPSYLPRGEIYVATIDLNQAIDQFFARIHRAALVLTGNPWDADDLAQETFLVMSRQVEQFEGRSSVYTWLYGILLNLERRERRRYGVQRRKLQVLWDAAEGGGEKSTPAAETRIEVKEWKHSLWNWVNRLPDGQRQALILRFSEGLRYDEIAEVLECPLGTVKSRIFHGLAGLRQMMDEQGEDARELPSHPYEDLSNVV
jgi:RNA polymerase sigma-70 factor (ECF subfamily)